VIREKIADFVCERELNPVIVDPIELTIMETEEKVFLAEICRGIVLGGGSFHLLRLFRLLCYAMVNRNI